MIGAFSHSRRRYDQIDAVGIGQAEVQKNDIGVTSGCLAHPGLATVGLHNAVPVADQRGSQEPPHLRFVLHNENHGGRSGHRSPRSLFPTPVDLWKNLAALERWGFTDARKNEPKAAPPPGRFSTQIFPPCARRMPAQIVRPRPTPPSPRPRSER